MPTILCYVYMCVMFVYQMLLLCTFVLPALLNGINYYYVIVQHVDRDHVYLIFTFTNSILHHRCSYSLK